MRIALIVPVLIGAAVITACTPNNSETESGATGSVASADLLPATSSAVVPSAAASPAATVSATPAAAAVAPPIRATPAPAPTPAAASETVYIARLRTLPESGPKAGATIDVLTAGRLASVAGCLVLQTDEGPALAVFNPAARFDPATGSVTQGGLRVTLGQPVTVTAVPRQTSDFGFLTKEPPSSCPKLVISMASLQRR